MYGIGKEVFLKKWMELEKVQCIMEIVELDTGTSTPGITTVSPTSIMQLDQSIFYAHGDKTVLLAYCV